MRAVQYQKILLLCFALLFDIKLALGFQPKAEFHSYEADETDSADQGRFLQQIIPTSCYSSICSVSGSLTNQDYIVFDVLPLSAGSKMIFNILVGTPRMQFATIMVTTPDTLTQTAVKVNPSTQWPGTIMDIYNGEDFQGTISIPSSTVSSRLLVMEIENISGGPTRLRLRVDVVLSIEESSNFPWLTPVIAAAAAALVLLGCCCVCTRIRRNRRRRMHSQRNRANSQRDQGVVIYYQVQHQPQQVIQFAQIPQNDPNSPHYQGAPMQMVVRGPDDGPLAQWNFNHRFPQAPLESFQSHFQQKTCSICLSDFTPGQLCRQLYCEHIFHGECVQLWLLNQMQKQHKCFCPNCNQSMTLVERAKPQ